MVLPPNGDDRDAALLERRCREQLRTAVRAWTSSRFSSLPSGPNSAPSQSQKQQPSTSADPLPSFPLASLNTRSGTSQVDYDSSSSSSPASSSPASSQPNSEPLPSLSSASATPSRSSPSISTPASSSSSSSSSSNTNSPSPSPSPPKPATIGTSSSKHAALAAAHAKSTFMTPKHAMSVPSLAKFALEQGGIYLYKTSMDAKQLERALAAHKVGSRQGRHNLLMSPDSPICLKEFGYLDLFTLDAATADELGMLEMDFYLLQPKGKVHAMQRKDARPGTPWTLVGQFSTGVTSLGQLLQGCISVRSEGSVRHSATAQGAGPSTAPPNSANSDSKRKSLEGKRKSLERVMPWAASAAAQGPLTHGTAAAALPLQAAPVAAPPKAAATTAMPPAGPSSGMIQGKSSTMQAHNAASPLQAAASAASAAMATAVPNSSGRNQGKPSALQAHKGPCRITNSVGRHMRGNASLC